ncbi:MAG TPA: TRAP transporter large permease [Thermodesulfobacteriota bacterium]|nr:TRAP transporter large permease [Thermodesulfobacteriota bacterium]
MTTFIVTAGMVILFLLGIPVGYSLGVAGLLAYFNEMGSRVNIPMLAQRMQYGVNNFLLLAIPLFILAAKLMNTAGITTRLFNFARLLVGFLPGGLGHANSVASLIFSGMSGAAVADAAGLGQVELKAMKDEGYDADFSVAITAASSTIGPIFPPSIPMVIFGLVAEVSVGRLFLGGVVPGLVMTVALMIMVAIYARRKNYPRIPFPGFREIIKGFSHAFLPMLTPIILLGGIWSGQFTATEAAAMAVAYALVLGVVIYREIGMKDLGEILISTAKETAAIGIIVCAANFFGWLLLRTGLTIKVTAGISGLTTDPLILLLVINIFLLIVGCFMETVVAILILTPMLMPIIIKVGIDPLHFGLVMVLNLMIGLLTPPFGMVLFVMAGVSGLPIERVVRSTLPFLIPLLIVLFLITIFPPLVTWLPSLVMGK